MPPVILTHEKNTSNKALHREAPHFASSPPPDDRRDFITLPVAFPAASARDFQQCLNVLSPPSLSPAMSEQCSGEITASRESHLALNYNKLDPYTNSISCSVTTPIKTESESRASQSAVRTPPPIANSDLHPSRR